MKALVRVEDDWMRHGVALHMAEEVSPGILHIRDHSGLSIVTEDMSAGARVVDVEPLRMSEDMARALYEGLARHFGGHPETASLRKDYEAERARVDKLIDFATSPPMIVTEAAR